MKKLLRKIGIIIGTIWGLPITILLWLFYLLPIWTLGWVKYDGMADFGILRFIVNPDKYNWYTRLWSKWGGCALGNFMILNFNAGISVEWHELRHNYQWLILGPLFPVVYGLFYLYELVKWRSFYTAYVKNILEKDARNYATKRNDFIY